MRRQYLDLCARELQIQNRTSVTLQVLTGNFGMTMNMKMSTAGQKISMKMTMDSEITAH